MIAAHDVERVAGELRREVLRMIMDAGAGHLGSSLGLADFFATMYLGGVLRYNPHEPYWEGRDRLVVSNGHVAPIWYAALLRAGFARADRVSYAQFGSLLQGHPEIVMKGRQRIGFPGVENTGGSLGQGVSVATGIAAALRLGRSELVRRYGKMARVICLMSDAETQEGQTWEALQFASIQKLDVIFVIDRNNIMIDAMVDEVSPIEPLTTKLEVMGIEAREVDGHDVDELRGVFEKLGGRGPIALVMRTTAGKGVSFMEGRHEWHDRIPSESEYREAMKELGGER